MKTKKFVSVFFFIALFLTNMAFAIVVSPPVGRFDNSGQKIVTANGKVAKLWNCPSGSYITDLSGHKGNVLDAAFSPDDSIVGTASSDKTAILWNSENGELITTLKGHTRGLSEIKFAPNGNYVVTSSSDGYAKIWDYDGNLIKDLNQGTYIWKMAFNNAGTFLATMDSAGIVKVWDLNVGENFGNLVATFEHAATIGTWVEFNLDDNKIVTAGKDAVARLWDWNDVTHEVTLVKEFVHGEPVPSRLTCASISPDSSMVITTSKDRFVKIWDVDTGECLTLTEHATITQSSRFNPIGDHFVTASFDNTARIWNINSSQSEFILDEAAGGHTEAVYWADYDVSGFYIVTASYDGTEKLWNALTGQLIATLD